MRLRDKIGPEVESVDMLQIERRMQALDAADGGAETAASPRPGSTRWPGRRPRPWTGPYGSQMATLELCREKRFERVLVQVRGRGGQQPGDHPRGALLPGRNAGYPYIDENDVGNLVAELMLKRVAASRSCSWSTTTIIREWILLGEDGYIPDQFIEGRPQIKVVTCVALGGMAHCSRLKLGRMTLACLAEDNEGYRMHIVTGEGRTPPQWVEMGVSLPSWPSVKFFPDVPVRRILDHVQSQHFAMTYGNHVRSLARIYAASSR